MGDQMEEMGIQTEETEMDIWVNRVLQTTLPAITIEEVREAMAIEQELKEVLKEQQEGTKEQCQNSGAQGTTCSGNSHIPWGIYSGRRDPETPEGIPVILEYAEGGAGLCQLHSELMTPEATASLSGRL